MKKVLSEYDTNQHPHRELDQIKKSSVVEAREKEEREIEEMGMCAVILFLAFFTNYMRNMSKWRGNKSAWVNLKRKAFLEHNVLLGKDHMMSSYRDGGSKQGDSRVSLPGFMPLTAPLKLHWFQKSKLSYSLRKKKLMN